MNHSGILHNNDVSLKIEDRTHKNGWHSSAGNPVKQSQYHSSTQQSIQNPQVQQIANQTNNNNLGIRQASSHRMLPNATNSVPYRVNVHSANEAESKTKVNVSTNQNGSTAPNLQLTNPVETLVEPKDIAANKQSIFGCSLGAKPIAYIIIQLVEKFLFFTLFLYSVSSEVFQIVIGIVYGVSSAFKYFLFIYISNFDLQVKPSTRPSSLTRRDSASEEGSTVSAKKILCEKCDINVDPEAYHCDNCNKCIYQQFFHSNLYGSCISIKNKKFIEIIICLNLLEAIIVISIGLLSIQRVISSDGEYNPALSSDPKIVIVIVSGILVAAVFACLIINGIFLRKLRQTLIKRPPITPLQKITKQMRNGEDTKSINHNVPSSLKQKPLLGEVPKFQPTFIHSASGVSQTGQHRFESHWKISPPDGKMNPDVQMASMNSSGTIMNFISKKIASCENLDKYLSHSPSKSVKSLNSIENPTISKSRKKSLNFSEVEIAGRKLSMNNLHSTFGDITPAVSSRQRNQSTKNLSKNQKFHPAEAHKTTNVQQQANLIMNHRKRSEDTQFLNSESRDQINKSSLRNFSVLSGSTYFRPPSKPQN